MNQDLRDAMKARDLKKVSALRTIMAVLDNAEAVAIDPATQPKVPTTERHEVPRKQLSEAAIHQLLQQEITSREQTRAQLARLGRREEAEALASEIALLAAYL